MTYIDDLTEINNKLADFQDLINQTIAVAFFNQRNLGALPVVDLDTQLAELQAIHTNGIPHAVDMLKAVMDQVNVNFPIPGGIR